MSSIPRISALMLALAGAFRARPKKRVPGQVAELVLFGAPATARPALTNPLSSDGCFPGVRISNVYWKGPVKKVDQFTAIAGLIGFSHAKMTAVEVDTKGDSTETLDCTVERTWTEPTGFPNGEMHEPWIYVNGVVNHSLVDLGIAKLSNELAHVDPGLVERDLKGLGWRVVNAGFDDGSEVGGQQYSTLVQNPDTLDCVLAFQGSKTGGDWFANLDVRKGNFCGLAEEVHRGFRDHLKQIVQNPSWQSNVRPQLSGCRKVTITGHSMGAAKSELFAACVAHAPKKGEEGFEDYNAISWVQEQPRRLPYLFD